MNRPRRFATRRCVAELNAAATNDKEAKKRAGKSEGSDIYKVVKLIMDRNYDPVIVFSFSKRECETLALQMAQLDLTGEEEKRLVDNIYWSALDCLSEDDRRLPQVSNLLPMLRRGIGVHHSGLLPILKEVIEILFQARVYGSMKLSGRHAGCTANRASTCPQEGLLKCLFATETFSTGLNMPAKTVVFTSVRKYDGGRFRWITSGEYIQMSGRAGRRGLDDRGVVILMMDSKMEPAVAKDMIQGAPDIMYSEFHLKYSMLLNLMRLEGQDPAEVMRRSFRQFQTERAVPHLQRRVKELEAARAALQCPEEAASELLRDLLHQSLLTRAESQALVSTSASSAAIQFLQPGRLVRVATQELLAAAQEGNLIRTAELAVSVRGHSPLSEKFRSMEAVCRHRAGSVHDSVSA